MVGFHRPVYTGRRRKSPRGRRLGGRENRRGGGLGRQASFDHSDKVSEGKKSRKSQTNKQTNEKGRGKGGLKLQGEKESGKKTSTKFAAWHSVLVKHYSITIRGSD